MNKKEATEIVRNIPGFLSMRNKANNAAAIPLGTVRESKRKIKIFGAEASDGGIYIYVTTVNERSGNHSYSGAFTFFEESTLISLVQGLVLDDPLLILKAINWEWMTSLVRAVADGSNSVPFLGGKALIGGDRSFPLIVGWKKDRVKKVAPTVST